MPREFQLDNVVSGSEIKAPGDEVLPLVETDSFSALKIVVTRSKVLTRSELFITLPNIERRRHFRESIVNRQCADLLAIEQLVREELHGPYLIGRRQRLATFLQLHRRLPLRVFVQELRIFQDLKSMDALSVHRPASPIPAKYKLAGTCKRCGSRRFCESTSSYLPAMTTKFIVRGRTLEHEHAAITSDVQLPDTAKIIGQLPSRPLRSPLSL